MFIVVEDDAGCLFGNAVDAADEFFFMLVLLCDTVRRAVGSDGNGAIAVGAINFDVIFLQSLQGRFVWELVLIPCGTGDSCRFRRNRFDEGIR